MDRRQAGTSRSCDRVLNDEKSRRVRDRISGIFPFSRPSSQRAIQVFSWYLPMPDLAACPPTPLRVLPLNRNCHERRLLVVTFKKSTFKLYRRRAEKEADQCLHPNSLSTEGAKKMEVQMEAFPPTRAHKHRKYGALIEALKTQDCWVAVSTKDVAGASTAQKQSAVHGTCRRAGLKVETRTTATQIFVRTLKSPEVCDAH